MVPETLYILALNKVSKQTNIQDIPAKILRDIQISRIMPLRPDWKQQSTIRQCKLDTFFQRLSHIESIRAFAN